MELVGGLFILVVLGLLGLLSTICGIIVLIAAFQDGIVEGLLCLFIPFYIFYYTVDGSSITRNELLF